MAHITIRYNSVPHIVPPKIHTTKKSHFAVTFWADENCTVSFEDDDAENPVFMVDQVFLVGGAPIDVPVLLDPAKIVGNSCKMKLSPEIPDERDATPSRWGMRTSRMRTSIGHTSERCYAVVQVIADSSVLRRSLICSSKGKLWQT